MKEPQANPFIRVINPFITSRGPPSRSSEDIYISPITYCCMFIWTVLSVEQMSKRLQFSLGNDEQRVATGWGLLEINVVPCFDWCLH